MNLHLSKDAPNVDDSFDQGDDNALQAAMLKQLEQTRDQQLTEGNEEQAARTQEDIDALRAKMAEDNMTDPNDTHRDDLDVK